MRVTEGFLFTLQFLIQRLTHTETVNHREGYTKEEGPSGRKVTAFKSVYVWPERKYNHSTVIKEIPQTQLGWLGQRQLVHILKWERLADWQTGRKKKNCLQARKYQLDNIASPLLPPCYSIQFVRGLPLCAKQPDHQGIWFVSHTLKISAWILEDSMWYVFIKQKRVNISPFCTSRSSTSSNSFSWTAGGKSSMSETQRRGIGAGLGLIYILPW